MPQVTAEKTPYVAPVIAGAFIWAYTQVTGRDPVSQASYLMPMAQSAVETGYWRSMFNNNTGNVTSAGGADEWMFEYVGSHRFRSYPTLGQGALAQMRWLAKHGALGFADSNDLTGYIGALKGGCYVGCPPEGDMSAYQASMASAMHKYNGVTPVPYSESGLMLTSTTRAWLLGGALLLGAAGVAYVIHEGFLDAAPKRRLVRRNPLEEDEDEAVQRTRHRHRGLSGVGGRVVGSAKVTPHARLRGSAH